MNNMSDTKINILPVPTFRWLGVNDYKHDIKEFETDIKEISVDENDSKLSDIDSSLD